MKPHLGEEKTRLDGTEWDAWYGGPAAEGSGRILGAARGKARAYVMCGENGSPKTGEAVARACVEAFFAVPSVKPSAARTILMRMNGKVPDLARMGQEQDFHFDAAAFFICRNQASWLVSGEATVLLFADGKLYCRSPAAVFPSLGLASAYQNQPADPFPLPEDYSQCLALLLCQGLEAGRVDIRQLQASLCQAKRPGQWLADIMPRMCPDKSALAAFLPPKRGLAALKDRIRQERGDLNPALDFACVPAKRKVC